MTRETIEDAVRNPDEVLHEETVVRLHKKLDPLDRLIVYVVQKKDRDEKFNLVITVWVEKHAEPRN
ncbi:MAG: hypothetical protein AAB353_02955 [Candidatus Hydrogenedentota bacterium]